MANTIGFLSRPFFELEGGAITLLTVLYIGSALGLLYWISRHWRRWIRDTFLAESPLPQDLRDMAGSLVQLFFFGFGAAALFSTAGSILPRINRALGDGFDLGSGMVTVSNAFNAWGVTLAETIRQSSGATATQVRGLLDYPIFRLDKDPITLSTILFLSIAVLLLLGLTARMSKFVAERLLAESKVPIGTRQALATITRYFVLLIGFLVILTAAGIDLTTLSVLAGAIGIGVGFGLQSLANNLVSGLVILFERPIKVGDRVEVNGIDGDVVAINGRSTTIVTNDNIAIIVPNSKFITENVVNWSFTNEEVRFHVRAAASYDNDVDVVAKVLLDAAADVEDVLVDPAPEVWLNEFGENGYAFNLLVWTRTQSHRPNRFRSNVNMAISRRLSQAGIKPPFPQRDLHFKEAKLDVKLPKKLI